MEGLGVMRPRRLRESEQVRRLVRETRLSLDELVYPIFVKEGEVAEAVRSMPGVSRLPLKMLAGETEEVRGLGLPAVLLFGLPSKKDPLGSDAYSPNGIVQRAVREIKGARRDLMVITDVCLCQYTNHGHCGIVEEGRVINDKTLELLAKTAVSHARAGADMVAPSAMMDHQVAAIRRALDEEGFAEVPILAYSSKFASSFYSPFREAADSTPSFGDRRSYQMDPANAREAVREMQLDIEEGADMVMVKPALAYLDVIFRARQRFNVPIAAFNVSGEYAMIKAAARNGWLDEKQAVMELLTSIKRAGADVVITYFAKDVARWLKGG
jgi:porphobilinogen synthase